MLKKGQLVTALNLNTAFLSKTSTASQTVVGPVTFSGGITSNVDGNLSGNASTASRWATARTITVTGDVTGTSPSWSGSGNLTNFNITLVNSGVTAGTYGSASQVPKFTVDSKGRVTSASSVNISISASAISSGTLPVARGGTGVTSLSNIVGTTNQVSVSNGNGRVIGGNVVLSLPQDIHTGATPEFAGLTIKGNISATGDITSSGVMDAKGYRFKDTRNVNDLPSEKQSRALSLDFKSRTSVGSPPLSVSASSSYAHIVTIAGWNTNESSGGWPVQLTFAPGGIGVRQATSSTTWGPWSRTVMTDVKINAGDGLTQGGDLSGDVTLSLGTPGSITATSTNSVSGTTHTHALSIASLTPGTGLIGSSYNGKANRTWEVDILDSVTSTSVTQAAAPKSVKTAYDEATKRVLKTGDTMRLSQNNMLKIYAYAQNQDQDLLRFGDRDGSYGFNIRYTGTEEGVNNALELWTDNQTNTSNRQRAFWINQDGLTTLKQISVETSASVSSTLSVDGDIIGNAKKIIRTTDGWLRLNPDSEFTSGVYSPKGIRGDGGLAAGNYTLTSNEVRADIFRGGNSSYYVRPSSTTTSALFAGNVGIGTTSPVSTSKLDVRGTIRAENASGSSFDGLILRNDDYGNGSTVSIKMLNTNTDTATGRGMELVVTRVNDGAAATFKVGTGASSSSTEDLLHLDGPSGRVGIGTTAPSSRLEVGANTANDEVITVRSRGFSGLELLGDTADGSGEPGGAYVLLSQDAGTVSGILGVVNVAGRDGSGTSFSETTANSLLLGNRYSGSLHLGTNSATRMTINSSGNVGIGTTSPSRKLDVSGDIGLTGKIYGGSAQFTGSSATNSAITVTGSSDHSAHINLRNTGSGGGNYHIISTNSGWTHGGNRLLVTSGGASSTNFVFSIDSGGDVRWKGTLQEGTVPWSRLSGILTATTSRAGIVQLNNTVTSTSTTQAATANAVKAANDNANTRLALSGGTMTGALDMNNQNITRINHMTIADPGPDEGIEWLGGSGWKIYESPDNLTTNGAGNLQIVQGSTRRMTVGTDGKVDSPGGYKTGGFVIEYNETTKSLDFNFIG